MNGRAISSSIACALLVVGLLSCASGVPNTALPPGSRCLALSSDCSFSNDCCSQLCQNGSCVEQPGAT
ncbi:MAG TPA: hypothetical protein VK762_34235 [Polyangiaceae bacterium]|jgi:hypothetical protein|nr:hypothetical protein [Polyangiaceae bacterium]